MTYTRRYDFLTSEPPGYPPPLHQVPRYDDMKNGIQASGRSGVPQHRYESKQQKTADRCKEWLHEQPDTQWEDPNETYPNPFPGYRRRDVDPSNDIDRRSRERSASDIKGVRHLHTNDHRVEVRFSEDKERPRGRGGYGHRERKHFDSDDDEYSDRRPSRHMRPGSRNEASHLPPAPEYDDLGKGKDSTRFDRASYKMRSDSRDAERPRTRTPDLHGDEMGRRSDAFGRPPVSTGPDTRYAEQPRSREAGGNRFGGTRESSRVGMPRSAMRSSSHVARDSRSRGHEESRFQRSGGGVGVDVASDIPVPGPRSAARHQVREHAPQYDPADSGIDEPLDTRRVSNRVRETRLPEEPLPEERMTQDLKERLSIHDARDTGRPSSYKGGIPQPNKLSSDSVDLRGVSSHDMDPLRFSRPELTYPGRGLGCRDDPDAKAMVVYRGGNSREFDHERPGRGRDSRRQDPDRTFVPLRGKSRGTEGSRYIDYGRSNSADHGRLERRARSSSGRRTSSRNRGASRHAEESKGRSKDKRDKHDKKDKKDKRGKKEIMIMRKPNKAQLFLVRSLH